MRALAVRLGFLEDGPLGAARAAVLEAIRSGTLAEYRSAWDTYHQEAERFIGDRLPSDTTESYAFLRIGYCLARAAIWSEAHDRVGFLRKLAAAEDLAGDIDDASIASAIAEPLSRAVTSRSFLAEYSQASGQIENAIELYIEREQDECLTDRERGMVNIRLAECYRALLDEVPDDEDAPDLLDGSIQSALAYLEGEPEQAWALRLLEELEERNQRPE